MLGHIFLRNDDVTRLDKEFRFFFDAAIDHALPVVHAVIPGKMEKNFIRFLNRAKERTPKLLDIVQHGWIHANHSRDAQTKYEFGPSRSLISQREDIRQGLERMRSAFGKNFTPAFVPPFHGYDQRTWDILKEEKFQLFSAGSRRPGKGAGIIELPATVSVTCYDDPAKIYIHQADGIIEKIIKNIQRDPAVGVVTHHADFQTASARKELTRLFKFIAALREQKKWQVYLFSDLLSKAKIKS